MMFSSGQNISNNIISQETFKNLEKVQIDDRMFFCLFRIFNTDGDNLILKKSTISQLSIECDLLNWYTKGFLMFNNTFDSIERFNLMDIDETGNTIEGYKFRGDGRDFFQFILFPEMDPLNPEKDTEDNDYKNTLYLEYIFSIYEIEDSPVAGQQIKYKKLFFHEVDYQILKERNLCYSTALSIADRTGQDVTQMTNADRSMYIPDIMKDIISKTFDFVDNPDDLFDNDNWDTSDRKIFYSSPAHNSAHDDLEYLYSLHISSEANDNDRCILTRDRLSKKWQLIPIKKLIESSTEKNIFEKIILQGAPGNNTTSNIPSPKTPNNLISLPNLSYINNYSFVPFSGEQNYQYITNQIIHSYDTNTKTFNMFSKDGDFQNSLDVFKSRYIDPLFGNNPTSAITKTKMKTNRKTVFHKNSIYASILSAKTLGLNANLYSGLFLNQALWFTVKGSTHRAAGQFIAVDRDDNYVDNDFDRRMLGVYLIVKVLHIFQNEEYFNLVVAVKPHFHDKIKLEEDNI